MFDCLITLVRGLVRGRTLDDNTSHEVTRMGIAFGAFALTNVGIEFSPELRRMGRGLHLPRFVLSGQPEK